MVSVSFDGEIGVDELEDRIKNSTVIKNTFNKTHDAFNTAVNLDPERTNTKTGKIGLVLQSGKKNKEILRILKGMISYHIMGHYVPTEKIAKAFQNYWTDLIGDEIISPKQITIRYVNFIPIGQEEKVEDVINLKIDQPYENVDNEFYTNQFSIDDKKITVVFAFSSKTDSRGVYFDHSVKQILNESDSKNRIGEIIQEIRPVKNKVFFTMLSDKTKNKYQWDI